MHELDPPPKRDWVAEIPKNITCHGFWYRANTKLEFFGFPPGGN